MANPKNKIIEQLARLEFVFGPNMSKNPFDIHENMRQSSRDFITDGFIPKDPINNPLIYGPLKPGSKSPFNKKSQ